VPADEIGRNEEMTDPPFLGKLSAYPQGARATVVEGQEQRSREGVLASGQ